MADRRSAICFGIILGTARLPSRRQRSQVARQAALSIMANTVFPFQCSAWAFRIDLVSNSAYQYQYQYTHRGTGTRTGTGTPRASRQDVVQQ